jgi:ribosomal protein S21
MSTTLVVPVFGNDVTTAFLNLKRATQRTGLLREMRVHEFYLTRCDGKGPRAVSGWAGVPQRSGQRLRGPAGGRPTRAR